MFIVVLVFANLFLKAVSSGGIGINDNDGEISKPYPQVNTCWEHVGSGLKKKKKGGNNNNNNGRG